jgi:hypothetical protein
VDFTRGHNLTPTVQAQLRLLDWIADNGGATPGVIVDLDPLFQGQDDEGAWSIARSLEALDDAGLIDLQEVFDWGGYCCGVCPAGARLIEELRTARGDLLGRRKAVREAFLTWLHDCTLRDDAHPSVNSFKDSQYGTYYGHEFTDDEIDAAMKWLRDKRYITGTPVPSGALAGLSITTRGERVVESGRSVNDHSPAAAIMSTAPSSPATANNDFPVTSSPGATITANSPGAVQTVTVTLTEDNRRQVAAVADQLEALLRLNGNPLGLDHEQTTRAEEAVAQLRDVAEQPAVEQGAVRRALEKAKEVAVSGTGTVLGQGVVALATQVLQALGLG